MKLKAIALTGVTQLAGCCPAKLKAAGWTLHQGICLGCWFGPQLGYMQKATDQCFSLKSMFLLPLFLPFPLSEKYFLKTEKSK